jgi:hypothetical protein
MKHQSSSPDSTTAMVDKIANIVSDYYDEDAAGRWRKCAQHIADSLTDEAATPGITGHQYRRARYEEPAATPQVSLKRMGLSDGRTDYFVMIKVGDREVSPHVFRDEYKAAYHVALYDWLLTGRGEKPEIVAFGPHDWPARPVDPAQCAWQPIETAPHAKRVLLGWRDWRDHQWCVEVGPATSGQRFDNGYSSLSQHGSATHWQPIPEGPAVTSTTRETTK